MAKRPNKALLIHEDPRTSQIGLNLANGIAEEVAHRQVRHGVPFFEARDQVLTEWSDEMVRQAGREAADRAVRLIHMLPPEDFLSPQQHRIVREGQARIDAIGAAQREKARIAYETEHKAILARNAPWLLEELYPEPFHPPLKLLQVIGAILLLPGMLAFTMLLLWLAKPAGA